MIIIILVILVVVVSLARYGAEKGINWVEDRHDARQAVTYLTKVKPAVLQQNKGRAQRQREQVANAVSRHWDRKIHHAEKSVLKALINVGNGKSHHHKLTKHATRADALRRSKQKEHALLSAMIGSSRIHKQTGQTQTGIGRAGFKPKNVPNKAGRKK